MKIYSVNKKNNQAVHSKVHSTSVTFRNDTTSRQKVLQRKVSTAIFSARLSARKLSHANWSRQVVLFVCLPPPPGALIRDLKSTSGAVQERDSERKNKKHLEVTFTGIHAGVSIAQNDIVAVSHHCDTENACSKKGAIIDSPLKPPCAEKPPPTSIVNDLQHLEPDKKTDG